MFRLLQVMRTNIEQILRPPGGYQFKLKWNLRCSLTSLPLVISDSSPVVFKLSLLINYLLGKRLGYARGEDGKARGGETLPSPFFLPVIPFVKEPVLVFHAEY